MFSSQVFFIWSAWKYGKFTCAYDRARVAAVPIPSSSHKFPSNFSYLLQFRRKRFTLENVFILEVVVHSQTKIGPEISLCWPTFKISHREDLTQSSPPGLKYFFNEVHPIWAALASIVNDNSVPLTQSPTTHRILPPWYQQPLSVLGVTARLSSRPF